MGVMLRMRHGNWAPKSMSISTGRGGGNIISDRWEQCCGRQGGREEACVWGREYGLVTMMQGRSGREDGA